MYLSIEVLLSCGCDPQHDLSTSELLTTTWTEYFYASLVQRVDNLDWHTRLPCITWIGSMNPATASLYLPSPSSMWGYLPNRGPPLSYSVCDWAISFPATSGTYNSSSYFMALHGLVISLQRSHHTLTCGLIGLLF